MSRARAWRPSYRLSDLWRAPLHDFPIRDEILYQYLPLRPDMHVLEVGPGSGFTAFRWAPQLARLTLLDVAPGNIARLRAALGGVPNLDFVCADICKPDLAGVLASRFDALYCIEVLELVPDPGAALRNMAALVRPGAPVLIQFPNYPPPRNPGISYFATRAELAQHMAEAGFSEWSPHALRLTPHAQRLYNAFHERPLALYRRLRRRGGQDHPLVYDQTWAYQRGRGLGPYKLALHTAWMILSAAMRAQGDCFERIPLADDILNQNLLLLARR
jgi:2-polyprenyl-3-methyl-5-hydroxy-6-metoxy-1,4-benzoquinol methylase